MKRLTEILEEFEPDLTAKVYGRVAAVSGSQVSVEGLSHFAQIGDGLSVERSSGTSLLAEVTGSAHGRLTAYTYGPAVGISVNDRVFLSRQAAGARPCAAWLGAVLDWRGALADGTRPEQGIKSLSLDAPAPAAPHRHRLGSRITTHHAVFDTFLPLCRGQRIGLFAGSGVGKSMLLASLASHLEADICVIALVGERGREVRAFVEDNLDEEARARTIVIATTSDQPALAKRQGARLAMTTAEYFRSEGKHVLLLFDSLTRYAEAHREIALAAGEPPSLHAFPPSTFQSIASFVERAGPGVENEGDITAIFSVLVAGSDMEEPVADIARGVLDGHVVLERAIAERGRFPAINVRKSVSRSLPDAATTAENALLQDARAVLSAYEDSELIVQAGLYASGADPRIDRAIGAWPLLDRFFSEIGDVTPTGRFEQLRSILTSGDHPGRATGAMRSKG